MEVCGQFHIMVTSQVGQKMWTGWVPLTVRIFQRTGKSLAPSIVGRRSLSGTASSIVTILTELSQLLLVKGRCIYISKGESLMLWCSVSVTEMNCWCTHVWQRHFYGMWQTYCPEFFGAFIACEGYHCTRCEPSTSHILLIEEYDMVMCLQYKHNMIL